MASSLGGPWQTLNEIRYYRGGDSTRQAVGKIIEEFKRLYEIINILDNGKSDGAGGTGVPAITINGKLENANIDVANVNGFEEAVKNVGINAGSVNGLQEFITDIVMNMKSS